MDVRKSRVGGGRLRMAKPILTAPLALALVFVTLASPANAAEPATALGSWTPSRFDSCPAQLHDVKAPESVLVDY